MRLTHFYHVFADGDWETPAGEHLEALVASDLIDNLDDMFLGIVGAESNRARVKRELPGVVVAEADTGWEQVTLNAVHDFAQTDDGAIFYAHTKGAHSRSDLADMWRKSMTHDLITGWRGCVEALTTVQACGSHWLQSRMPEHAEHDFFFAGNFWWAQSSYVAKLPALRFEHRYQAEGWIGLANPTVKVIRDGLADRGNFWRAS